MQIGYDCPTCSAPVRLAGIETLSVLACPHCGTALEVPADGFATDSPPRLARCLVCPSADLFIRKDFPQRLGVGIVVVGLLRQVVKVFVWRVDVGPACAVQGAVGEVWNLVWYL